MTRKDIEKMVAEGTLRYHHSATERGYLSVKRDGEVIPYSGKFGIGRARSGSGSLSRK